MKPGSLQTAFVVAFAFAVIILFCIITAGVIGHRHNADPSWAGVEQAFGTKGTIQPDGVFIVELPRSDIHVSIGDLVLARPMALHSFVAFMDMGQNTSMVMGDLALQPQEMLAVQSVLLDGGLDITAIHNTLVGESPQVYDVHFGGKGDPAEIASIVHNALTAAKVPYETSLARQNESEQSPVDIQAIDAVMGVKGSYEDGAVQYSVPRVDRIIESDMEIPQSMDVATSIKLQLLPDNRVAVTGEYVLLAGEVQPVMQALNRNNIMITATHTHMLNEEPKLYYLHIWAIGDSISMAKGLREAIGQTNAKI